MTLATVPLFLAEITAYSPTLGTTLVLRYASGNGYTTSPSATPANTFYDGKITNAVDISRTMFSGGTTMGRSTVGLGDLVLNNSDGSLDDLNDYGFDGQAVTIYRTTVLNPSYPSDFTTVLVGTMTVPELSTTEIRLKLRDRQQLVDVPFQTTKYAGTNVLPAGLEGVATDLKGKPKPVLYGTVKNIAPPCVNTSKLIYQVSDGVINSVDAVYDRGRAIAVGFKQTLRLNAAAGEQLTSVLYAGGQFVMTGSTSTAIVPPIYTSPDGITWTSRTSPFAVGVDINDLAYGAGVYVVVGSLGNIATSPDGITWTPRVSPFGTHGIDSIAFGAGVFVIGTSNPTPGPPEVASSPDGIAWTSHTSPFVSSTQASGVDYGVEAGFVMAGNQYEIATSVDGLTWTLQTATTNFEQPAGVSYAGGVYYIGVNSGAVLTSKDGASWVRRLTGLDIVVYEVTYGDGMTVAAGLIGSTGASFAVSLDNGVTWTDGYNIPGFGIAFGIHTFVFASNSSAFSTVVAGTYASQADLLDDTKAPAPGTYKAYLAGGLFRLGSAPIGTITCDATQGANAAARTAAQQFILALARVGLTSTTTDYNTTDITNLDAANSAVLGYWSGVEETTVGAVIDLLAQTVGAWWAVDASGVFRIKQFTAPSGTAALTVTQNDMLPPGLNRLASNDPGSGVPVYKVTHRWGKYYTTLTTDLAAGVDDATRAQFAQEWRDATDSDATVLTSHPLSQPLVIETLFSAASDAATEATRVLTLRKVKRDRYEITVPLNSETNALDLGTVLAVSHPRFGLSVFGDDTNAYAGLFRIIDIAPNAAAQEIRLGLWGTATGSRNVISDPSTGGLYLVSDTGVYVVSAAA